MLIVANWKAYVGEREHAAELFATAKRLARASGHAIVIAPPAPLLGMLARGNKSRVAFAAQDVSIETGGAATGEDTAHAFASAGAAYAIVGHSERRAKGDTNAMVAQKLQHASANGLTPILCVGERERDSEGRYLSGIREQLVSAFAPLSQKERRGVVIAYEPVWAIGKTAADAIRPDDLAEMVLYIRKVLAEFMPAGSTNAVRILYGGSAEPGNVRTLAGASGVSGFLPGHASADATTFAQLVHALS